MHHFGSVDAVALRGRGRAMPLAGGLFALGALLLASLPPSSIFTGEAMLGEAHRRIGYE